MDFLSTALLVGGIINLFLAISIYFLVKKLTNKSRHPKRWAWLAVAIWYALPLPYIWWQFYVMPLPSDEYMTSHFHKHRGEFEALVKAYREQNSTSDPTTHWDFPEHIRDVKTKTDVWRLTSKSSMRWFENPYSVEAAKLFHEKRTRGDVNVFKNHGFDGVIVIMNNARYHSLRERAEISKSYLHIPQIPRIENSKLLYPVNPSSSKYAKQRYLVIKESLDNFPDHWERGECFLKPLDAQWFIQLCKSY